MSYMTQQIEVTSFEIISQNHDLGEGLCVSKDSSLISWVDIHRHEYFIFDIHKNTIVRCANVKYPSKILELNNASVLVLHADGISQYFYNTHILKELIVFSRFTYFGLKFVWSFSKVFRHPYF